MNSSINQIGRIRIKDFLTLSLSQTQIEDKLKVHKSTISREIKRNSGLRGYRAVQAHKKSQERQSFRSNLRNGLLLWRKRKHQSSEDL